jgi:GT2 family glycosyltransferase
MINITIEFEKTNSLNSWHGSNSLIKIILDTSVIRLNARILNEIDAASDEDFSIPILIKQGEYFSMLTLAKINQSWEWDEIKSLLPTNVGELTASLEGLREINHLIIKVDSVETSLKKNSPILPNTQYPQIISCKVSNSQNVNSIECPPKIGVILRQWEAFEYSQKCIDDLIKTGYPNLELYLIDDASIDNSYLKLKLLFPAIRVIRFLDRQEYTRCLNAGAEVAIKNGCDYVFFTNNDTRGFNSETNYDFFSNLLHEFHANNKLGLVCPKVMDWSGAEIEIRTSMKLGLVFDIATEAYLIPSALWKKINGFDLSLIRYCEDIMILQRIKKIGYQVVVCPHSKFSHFGMGSSVRQVVIPTYYRVRNGMLVLKNTIPFFKKDFYKYLLKWLRPHWLAIKTELLKGWFLRAASRFISLLIGLLVGCISSYSQSKDWQCTRDILTNRPIAHLNIDRFFEKRYKKQ